MPYADGKPSILDDEDFEEYIKDKAREEAESVYATLKEENDPDIDEFCERSFMLGYCLSAGRMMDRMAQMMTNEKERYDD